MIGERRCVANIMIEIGRNWELMGNLEVRIRGFEGRGVDDGMTLRAFFGYVGYSEVDLHFCVNSCGYLRMLVRFVGPVSKLL